MTFSSKTLRYSIAVVIFLALTLASLRVYGLFTNERKEALLRAERAIERQESMETEADDIGRQIKSDFQLAEGRARIATSLEERAQIFAETNASAQATHDRQMTDIIEREKLQAYASAEREYAASRRLISKHILHKAWAAITGIREADEDWVDFLSAHTTTFPNKERMALEDRLDAAQRCDSRASACQRDCQHKPAQVVQCVAACGTCAAEWDACSEAAEALWKLGRNKLYN